MFVNKGWDYITEINDEHRLYNYFEYDLFFDIKTREFSFHVWNEYKYSLKGETEIWLGSFSDHARELYVKTHLRKQMNENFLFDFDDISLDDLKKHTNGIGSKWTKWIPDFCFYKSGCIHDYSYYVCNDKTKKNKKLIDKIFLYNMLINAKKNYLYKCMAFKYYLGVYLFAWIPFSRKEE